MFEMVSKNMIELSVLKIKSELVELECPLVESLNEADMYDVLYKPETSARYALIKWLYIQISPKFNRILNEYLPTQDEKQVDNLLCIALTLGLCNKKNGVKIINGTGSKNDQYKFWLELLELVKLDNKNLLNTDINISEIYTNVCRIIDKILNYKSVKNISNCLFEDCETYFKEYKKVDFDEKFETILLKTNKMIDDETNKYKCTVVDFENEKITQKNNFDTTQNDNINQNMLTFNTLEGYNVGNEKNNGILMWDKMPICEMASLKKYTNDTFDGFEQLIKNKFKPFLHHNMKNVQLEDNCLLLDEDLLENIHLNGIKYSKFIDNITNTNMNMINIEKTADSIESHVSISDLPDDILLKQLYNVFQQCSQIDNDLITNKLFKYDDPLWD